MATKRITEDKIILAALTVIGLESSVTTEELKTKLKKIIVLSDEDKQTLEGRTTTNFDQTVGNLISHKTLEKQNLAKYTKVSANRGVYTITATGKKYLSNKMTNSI